jgi:hypothetical protein
MKREFTKTKKYELNIPYERDNKISPKIKKEHFDLAIIP